MSMNRFLGLIVFFVMISLASSTYISDGVLESHRSTGRSLLQAQQNGVLESHRSTGRSLLQAQQNCPIIFENQNYTVITSQCKGPKYSPDVCCKAFKEFACPFAENLNDLSNNCASTMFSYINLCGKYPPGLFANECKEGKNGLACDAQDNVVSKSTKTNNAHTAKVVSPLVILASSLVFFFCLF